MAELISMLAAAGGAGGEVDPNFNQTVLLLHGDNTNGAQNNTFLDSSTNNFTITRNGNTTQGTFSPFSAPDGRWSNYFDGSGDYLSVTNDNVFDTNSTFTLEVWVYLTATSTQQIFGRGGGGSPSWNTTNGTQFALYYDSGGIVWQWNNAGSATSISGGTVNLNAWNHVAVGYDGTTTRLWLNGTSIGSSATGYTLPTTRNVIRIGSWTGTASEYLSGYASNLRFVKGTDVYGVSNTSITVPTNSLTAITNTAFLTCQSNRFVDNSSNAFAITRNGDVKVTPFSPFAPTAAYDASVNGGSGYFDGTGDYLNTPSSGQFAPTGDFTVAWWYYPTTLQTTVFIANYTGNNSTDWSFETDSTGDFNVYLDGSTQRITGSTVIKLNQWNYLVVSRSGTTVTAYCNGSSIGTYTLSGTFGSASKAIRIGGGSAGTNNMFGYCAGVSLIDGTALDGTIPTAPPTAVSGTELLCNFTNAGIFDNTGKNNLETVGNAQIDTTTKKFGTGSMEFDGTGDYLLGPSSVDFDFGSGDFTIEMWLYLNATTDQNIVAKWWTGGQQWVLQFRAAGSDSITNQHWRFYANNGTTAAVDFQESGTTSVATGVWYHIALSRNGSSYKFFRDGTQIGSTYTNSAAITATTDPLSVGQFNNSGLQFLNGLIDDLRITKGVARYTSNFTAPTKAFPDL